MMASEEADIELTPEEEAMLMPVDADGNRIKFQDHFAYIVRLEDGRVGVDTGEGDYTGNRILLDSRFEQKHMTADELAANGAKRAMLALCTPRWDAAVARMPKPSDKSSSSAANPLGAPPDLRGRTKNRDLVRLVNKYRFVGTADSGVNASEALVREYLNLARLWRHVPPSFPPPLDPLHKEFAKRLLDAHHVVKSHGWFVEERSGDLYGQLVLDLCEGADLMSWVKVAAEKVQESDRCKGLITEPTLSTEACIFLPPEVVGSIAYQMLRGLRYAHGLGVCNRDVKVDNLLVKEPASDAAWCMDPVTIPWKPEVEHVPASGAAAGGKGHAASSRPSQRIQAAVLLQKRPPLPGAPPRARVFVPRAWPWVCLADFDHAADMGDDRVTMRTVKGHELFRAPEMGAKPGTIDLVSAPNMSYAQREAMRQQISRIKPVAYSELVDIWPAGLTIVLLLYFGFPAKIRKGVLAEWIQAEGKSSGSANPNPPQAFWNWIGILRQHGWERARKQLPVLPWLALELKAEQEAREAAARAAHVAARAAASLHPAAAKVAEAAAKAAADAAQPTRRRLAPSGSSSSGAAALITTPPGSGVLVESAEWGGEGLAAAFKFDRDMKVLLGNMLRGGIYKEGGFLPGTLDACAERWSADDCIAFLEEHPHLVGEVGSNSSPSGPSLRTSSDGAPTMIGTIGSAPSGAPAASPAGVAAGGGGGSSRGDSTPDSGMSSPRGLTPVGSATSTGSAAGAVADAVPPPAAGAANAGRATPALSTPAPTWHRVDDACQPAGRFLDNDYEIGEKKGSSFSDVFLATVARGGSRASVPQLAGRSVVIKRFNRERCRRFFATPVLSYEEVAARVAGGQEGIPWREHPNVITVFDVYETTYRLVDAPVPSSASTPGSRQRPGHLFRAGSDDSTGAFKRAGSDGGMEVAPAGAAAMAAAFAAAAGAGAAGASAGAEDGAAAGGSEACGTPGTGGKKRVTFQAEPEADAPPPAFGAALAGPPPAFGAAFTPVGKGGAAADSVPGAAAGAAGEAAAQGPAAPPPLHRATSETGGSVVAVPSGVAPSSAPVLVTMLDQVMEGVRGSQLHVWLQEEALRVAEEHGVDRNGDDFTADTLIYRCTPRLAAAIMDQILSAVEHMHCRDHKGIPLPTPWTPYTHGDLRMYAVFLLQPIRLAGAVEWAVRTLDRSGQPGGLGWSRTRPSGYKAPELTLHTVRVTLDLHQAPTPLPKLVSLLTTAAAAPAPDSKDPPARFLRWDAGPLATPRIKVSPVNPVRSKDALEGPLELNLSEERSAWARQHTLIDLYGLGHMLEELLRGKRWALFLPDAGEPNPCADKVGAVFERACIEDAEAKKLVEAATEAAAALKADAPPPQVSRALEEKAHAQIAAMHAWALSNLPSDPTRRRRRLLWGTGLSLVSGGAVAAGLRAPRAALAVAGIGAALTVAWDRLVLAYSKT